jgi:ABC-2 type transport system ATP-binding protein
MIETRDLTKRYRSVLALDRLTLRVGEGEIFGFIGPNGAGKTTTIRILAGLLRPTSGTVRVAGVDVTRRPRQARLLVGYLPDGFGVYPGMRVWEYLDFFGAAYRIPRRVRGDRIEHALHLAGAEIMRDYFVDSLSRGMLQRVGLAKTLLHDPPVLLLDEPTSGLDPRARIEIRELMKRLRALKKTLIVSSHILPELATVCDHIGIVERGRLLVSGTVGEVMRQVRQERFIDIEVLGDPKSAAETLLRLRPGAITVREIVGRQIRVGYSAGDEEIAALLADLVRAGVPVIWQSEPAPDLEQIYLSVTEAAKAGARRVAI